MRNFGIFHLRRVPGCQEAILIGEKKQPFDIFSSFWWCCFTKSVGLRLPELLISVSDAEFWDLSFAMGPGGQFFEKNTYFFKKLSTFGEFLDVKNGEKSEMFGEIGQNSSKFGNFDTDRCARISGPQKCWFWPTFPVQKIWSKNSFFFFGYFWASRVLLLAPINPELTWN